jgi:aspartate aminotransferase-like enzyme
MLGCAVRLVRTQARTTEGIHLKTRLFTPGPVEIPARLLAALARPALHHRTEGFRAILSDATQGLIELFGTEGTVVTLGASGSGGMEAAVVNLVEPGRARWSSRPASSASAGRRS